MTYQHCSWLIGRLQYFYSLNRLDFLELLNMLTLAYSYLRFSSTEQAKGNSFERQIRLRDTYVTRKGLTLDTSLHLQDAGVSAFRGMNASTGALRGFLDS